MVLRRKSTRRFPTRYSFGESSYISPMKSACVLVLTAIVACTTGSSPSPRLSRTGLGYVAPVPARNVPDDGWTDPAPHRAIGIQVAPDVRLHVLDFGGSGLPIVFLTGIGNNAHVFDDFAQRFTRDHRVIAITRRGFGESSHPDGPCDQPTLAADIHAVLDSLGIQRTVLAGHSIGGYELTHFGARYPERVAGLIYLDAGTDPVAADSIRKSLASAVAARSDTPRAPPPKQIMPTDADSASPAAAWAYRQRVGLIDNTESAVRAAYFYEGFNPYLANNNPVPAKMIAAINAGERTPFAKVRAPAIFIFAQRDSSTDVVAEAQHEYVHRELKNSRLVNIIGARHLIFLTHPDEVERAMRAFIRELKP